MHRSIDLQEVIDVPADDAAEGRGGHHVSLLQGLVAEREADQKDLGALRRQGLVDVQIRQVWHALEGLDLEQGEILIALAAPLLQGCAVALSSS